MAEEQHEIGGLGGAHRMEGGVLEVARCLVEDVEHQEQARGSEGREHHAPVCGDLPRARKATADHQKHRGGRVEGGVDRRQRREVHR